jgi:hypothetical protein
MATAKPARRKLNTLARTFALPVVMLSVFSGSINAETTLRVPDNAIQVDCKQEFKDLENRFYQYILIFIDAELGETLQINLPDPTSSWSGSALVYLENEQGVQRLVNKVDFFQDGNGGYISGLEGYRYGSFGVGSNNGVFITYETREELGDAIFDKILGCFILQ